MSKVKSSEKGDLKDVNSVADATKVNGLSNEEMQLMLLDLKKELDEIKNSKKSPEQSDAYNTIDDYLEYPAVFFSFSSEYAIHADIRNGRESLPPLNDFIKFKRLYRYSRKGAGRAVETVAVSQATVRSKTTADWLRNHTLFGIKFFENINDVNSIDVTFAEKMAEAASRVSSMSDMQVIERSRNEDIPTHTDLDKLRKELIQKLAKKDIQRVKKRQELEFKAERDDNNRKVEYRDSVPNGAVGEVY